MHARAFSLALVAALVAALSGCDGAPPSDELDRLRAVAQAANRAKAAQASADPDAKRPATLDAWTLGLYGRTGLVATLDGKQLDALATESVVTVAPPPFPTTAVTFRTLSIRALLDRFFAGQSYSDDETVTLIAEDAFRSTVALRDARAYPIGLAVARDGHLLTRAEAGPLYLVFPQKDHPELVDRYPDRYWAFYVRDVIVGTEPARLHVVGGKDLDAAALQALPKVSFTRPVEFGLHWPRGDVRVTGVRIRDVLAAAGVSLAPGSRVTVRGKAPVHHNAKDPRTLAGKDVLDHDVILALGYGDSNEPIRAELGGPIALAFPRELDADYGTKYWISFVEEIDVTP